MDNGVSFSGAIMDVAVLCVSARQSRDCKNRFDDPVCNKCQYYIKRYVPCDDNSAALFMIQAKKRYYQQYGHLNPNGHRRYFIVGILFLLVWTIVWYQDDLRIYKLGEESQAKQTTVQPANTVVRRNDEKDIRDTLEIVAERYRNKVDVNHDGLTNCIDAAVTFYQYYPRREDVVIVRNDNGSFDHLFNAVRLQNGHWTTIEPQARSSQYAVGTYSMEAIWGKRYDPNYNSDWTSHYSRYARR